ncbi:MAG: hypothetical protein ACQEVA_22665 [Myxococcota bacterium]
MNWTTRLIGTLAACGVMLGASAAVAQTTDGGEDVAAEAEVDAASSWTGHGVGIAVRTGSQYETDPGFDALGDANAFPAGGAVELDYRLDYLGVDGLTTFATARWTGRSAERFSGQTDFDWTRGLYMLGAQYGPWEFGTFRPLARLAAGYSTQRLAVSTSQPTMSDRTHDLAGMGSIGFEWLTPRGFIKGAPMRLGLLGQVGYLAQTSAEFDDLNSESDDDWSRAALDLGTLPTSGVFWDLGINLVYEW